MYQDFLKTINTIRNTTLYPRYKLNSSSNRLGYGTDYLIRFPFGKKMYMVKDNALIAIIPLECIKAQTIESFLGSSPCYGGFSNVLVCKMAGQSELQAIDSLTYKKFFLTKEDYERWVEGDKSAEFQIKDHKFDIVRYFTNQGFRVETEGCGKPWDVRGYYISTNRTSTYNASMRFSLLCLNENGVEFDFEDFGKIGSRYFKTETECLKANRANIVIDFDDEVEEEKTYKVCANVSFEVSAKDVQEIQEKIAAKVKGLTIESLMQREVVRK